MKELLLQHEDIVGYLETGQFLQRKSKDQVIDRETIINYMMEHYGDSYKIFQTHAGLNSIMWRRFKSDDYILSTIRDPLLSIITAIRRNYPNHNKPVKNLIAGFYQVFRLKEQSCIIPLEIITGKETNNLQYMFNYLNISKSSKCTNFLDSNPYINKTIYAPNKTLVENELYKARQSILDGILPDCDIINKWIPYITGLEEDLRKIGYNLSWFRKE